MTIHVKGIDDKLLITITHGNWTERSRELIDYVCENAGFLSGAKVILCLDDFILRANDLFMIKDSFAELYSRSIIIEELVKNTIINMKKTGKIIFNFRLSSFFIPFVNLILLL